MAFKNRFHSTTLGVDAQILVAKAVAYTSQADFKSFQANAVEGEIGVFKESDYTVVSGGAAVAQGTEVFIALKRDGASERTVSFVYSTGIGAKVSTAPTVKHVITVTSTGIAASKAIQDITYNAAQAGTAGNSITITYVVAGANTPLTVTVAGTAITVNLSTTAGSASNATATQVAAAILASAAASALVVATITGTAATVQVAAGATALAGGTAEYTPSVAGGDYMELTLVETSPLAMPLPTYQYGISLKKGETYSSAIQRLVALINNATSIENSSRTQLVSAAVVNANGIVLTALRNYEHFTVALRGILYDNATAAVTTQFQIGSGVYDQVLIAEKAGDIRKGVTTNYPGDTNALPSEFGAPTSFVDLTGATVYRTYKFKFVKTDRARTLGQETRVSYAFIYVPQGAAATPDAQLATIFGL